MMISLMQGPQKIHPASRFVEPRYRDAPKRSRDGQRGAHQKHVFFTGQIYTPQNLIWISTIVVFSISDLFQTIILCQMSMFSGGYIFYFHIDLVCMKKPFMFHLIHFQPYPLYFSACIHSSHYRYVRKCIQTTCCLHSITAALVLSWTASIFQISHEWLRPEKRMTTSCQTCRRKV